MHRGYIKTYRCSVDNEMYFMDTFTRRQARQDLLLIANHKTGKINVRGNIIEIKRGQIGYSETTLGGRWKWSRGKVRRFLFYLETVQQIKQQKSKVKSIITIINYDKYQGNSTTDSTTDGHQTVQQTDTNKNDKNSKNDKNIKKEEFFLKSPEQKFEKKQKFDIWWNLYPNKKGKAKAKILFNRKITSEQKYQELMRGLKGYITRKPDDNGFRANDQQGDTFLSKETRIDYIEDTPITEASARDLAILNRDLGIYRKYLKEKYGEGWVGEHAQEYNEVKRLIDLSFYKLQG